MRQFAEIRKVLPLTEGREESLCYPLAAPFPKTSKELTVIIRSFSWTFGFVNFGLAGFASSLWSVSASALPFPPAPASVVAQYGAPGDTEFDFEGIVSLSNCSGSLVRLGNSQPADKAWVLTNGHCLEGGFLSNGEVVKSKVSTRSFGVLDKTGQQKLGSVRATRILYGTMTSTDLSLYELEKSYSEIESEFNTKAFVISEQRASVGTPLEVISGYWQRGYACSIQAFIPQLKEGEWVFTDSIKYQQPGCETIGGTSGSPVVNAETREVIGVNNTGNEDGRKCTLNNPCEVDEEGGVTVEKGAAYGQQIYQIASCVTKDRKFDLTLRGCALPKGK